MALYMLGRRYGAPAVIVCHNQPPVPRVQVRSTLRVFRFHLLTAGSTLARIHQPMGPTTSLSIHLTDSEATLGTTRSHHGTAGRPPTARVTCGQRRMSSLLHRPMLARRT